MSHRRLSTLASLTLGLGAAAMALTACGNSAAPVQVATPADTATQAASVQPGGPSTDATSTPSTDATETTQKPSASTDATDPADPTDESSSPVAPTPAAVATSFGDKQVATWPEGVTLPKEAVVTSVINGEGRGTLTVEGVKGEALVQHLAEDLKKVGLKPKRQAADNIIVASNGWRFTVIVDSDDSATTIICGLDD